jgi:hypothetical protein
LNRPANGATNLARAAIWGWPALQRRPRSSSLRGAGVESLVLAGEVVRMHGFLAMTAIGHFYRIFLVKRIFI